MKLLLGNGQNISFQNKDDLSKVIPFGLSGNTLNYGQGEGQVDIDGTVWGFYINSQGSYYMVLEEGVMEWSQMENLVSKIVGTINQRFGITAKVLVEGSLNGQSNV